MQNIRETQKKAIRLYTQLEMALSVLVAGMMAWLLGNRLSVKQSRRGKVATLPGQATLEWVLIGGIMVVIIIALLVTIFRPQLEAIVTNIMNLVQQNTSGS